MPLLFIIAVVAGGATVGAVETDGYHMNRSQSAQALTIDSSAHASVADCLTAAAANGIALSTCTNKE